MKDRATPGPHAPVSLHFHARRRRVWELQSEARIALKKKKKKEKNLAQGKSGMCCRCETKAKAKTKCKNPELSWDCFYLLFMFVLRMMDSNPAQHMTRVTCFSKKWQAAIAWRKGGKTALCEKHRSDQRCEVASCGSMTPGKTVLRKPRSHNLPTDESNMR